MVAHRFILGIALLIAGITLGGEARAQQAGTHVVEQGETLYAIARQHGITVEQLMAYNGITGDSIYPGQRLRVRPGGPPPTEAPVQVADDAPARPAPPPPPPDEPEIELEDVEGEAGATDENVHVVQPGENLFRIALRYDTSVGALRELNGLSGSDLAVGQRLRVSGGAAGAPAVAVEPWAIDRTTIPADLVHFVRPGETLYDLALRYGTTVGELTRIARAAGQRLTAAPLLPGQMIRLPDAIDPDRARYDGPPPLGEPTDTGLALVYPASFAGRRLADGTAYDPATLVASHRTLPIGSVVLLVYPASGKRTFVRIAERGPRSETYVMELSQAAADALGLSAENAGRIEVRRLPE
jgi:LysM repeat protein